MTHPEKQELIDAGDFQDSIIREATAFPDQPGWFNILTDGSWGFSWDFGDVVPVVGDSIRVFTKGFSLMRGVEVRGIDCGFKTEIDLANDESKRRIDENTKRMREYEEHKHEWDQQFSELPESFQRRIQFFRDHHAGWRWEFEPYELFCCTEAANLADYLMHSQEWAETGKQVSATSTKEEVDDAIEEFYESADAKEGALTMSEHSGNTMGSAISLARFHLYDTIGYRPEDLGTDEPLVYLQHGALTPLVGCEDYGCVHPR